MLQNNGLQLEDGISSMDSLVSNTVVVVPTIRYDNINSFLHLWRKSFAKCKAVIVVEDNPQKTFQLDGFDNVVHYSWEDIQEHLGEKGWIIPRRTDCIRSFGYLMAYRMGAQFIVTLDDDCYPTNENQDIVYDHIVRLSSSAKSEAWVSTLEHGVVPRGVPYMGHHRKGNVAINHGLWINVLDYDAVTQLCNIRRPVVHVQESANNKYIPKGLYYPMCGMNLSWRREVTPLMYFLLMGRDSLGEEYWPYDRFGDIWCGIISKKICDHLNWHVASGLPYVNHERASNVFVNLKKEASGIYINEELWRRIDDVVITESNPKDCYLELVDKVDFSSIPGHDYENNDYWHHLKIAMKEWVNLF